MKLKFYGNIKEGVFAWSDLMTQNKFTEMIVKQFNNKPVEIQVQKYVRQRTSKQNAYWHAVIVPIACNVFNDCGIRCDKKKAHEMLKAKFLTFYEVDFVSGEMLPYVKSTTELSTVEFNEKKIEIQQWFAEFHGVDIPDPEENILLSI